jgi:hypothetical protein
MTNLGVARDRMLRLGESETETRSHGGSPMRTCFAVFVLLVVPTLAFAQEAEKVEVSVNLIMADGRPGQGVVAGRMWQFMEYGPDHRFSRIPKEERAKIDGPMGHINELYTYARITADENGQITFAIAPSDLPETFFLMSRDQREGTILRFGDLPDILLLQGTEVRLEKMTTVKLDMVRPLPEDPVQSFVCVGVIHEASRSNIYFSHLDRKPREAHITTSFRLPAGVYMYYIQSDGCARNLRDLVIDENQAGTEVRIEAKLLPKFIRAFAGKTPPPLCTTGNVGDVSRDAIKEHKGRPLLLVFFQTGGCGPHEDVKELFERYLKLAPEQRGYRILIHCVRGIRDEKDYQTKVVEPIRLEHKDIDFSVPVLLDGDLCTIRSWGLDQFPTAILLDKDCLVVEQGNPMALWSRVDGPQ